MTDENFVHPYQGAYDLPYKQNYGGALSEEDVAARKAEWIDWVNKAHPLTMAIYKEMPSEQRKKYGKILVWGSAGGLKVVSRGIAYRKWNEIRKKWADIAAAQAKTAREYAGWSGKNFLIAPDGSKMTPTGHKYDRYTMPGAEYDRGMWDGILTRDKIFTK